MLIPRESFLLYLKFNAGYSVFSSAKSDNPFCFVSKCLWSSPTEEHFTRSQSFFPLKTRVAGTLHVGMASAFDFYSWGIHLFLKAKHVSRVLQYCFVLFSVLLLRFQQCVHPGLSGQGRFSTMCLTDVCAHLILLLAQEGVFVASFSTSVLYPSYFFSITVLISLSFVSAL